MSGHRVELVKLITFLIRKYRVTLRLLGDVIAQDLGGVIAEILSFASCKRLEAAMNAEGNLDQQMFGLFRGSAHC